MYIYFFLLTWMLEFSWHVRVWHVCNIKRYLINWIYIYIYIFLHSHKYGCQNFDLDLIVLWFYDLTCLKWSSFFKNLCNHSRSIRSYDSDNPKRLWFLVIFFNLTKGLLGPKWKIKSQKTKFFHSNIERVSVEPK